VEAIMLGDSKRAIQVNIQIIKTFTRLRQLVATNKEILEKIEKMEKNYDAQFRVVFDALRKEYRKNKCPFLSRRRIGMDL
jgi:hypothetical protein